MGTHTPSQVDQVQLVTYQSTLVKHSNTTLLSLNASNNALEVPNAELADNISSLGALSTKLSSSSKWLSGSDVAGLFKDVNYLNGNNTVFQPMGV